MCRGISLWHTLCFLSAGFEQDTCILMHLGHREFPKVKPFKLLWWDSSLELAPHVPTGLFGEMGWVPLQAEIKCSVLSSSGTRFALSLHAPDLPNVLYGIPKKAFGNWADKTIILFPDINLSNFSRMDRKRGINFWKWNTASGYIDHLNSQLILILKVVKD